MGSRKVPPGEGDLGWLLPFVDDAIADNLQLIAQETGTILLGRDTYRGFAGFWPGQQGEFADAMNLTPSSSSRAPARWSRSRGGATTTRGSSTRTSSGLGLGLVDELRVVVCLVVLGSGKRYLRDIGEQVPLELVEARPYPRGSARLTYRVAT